MPDTQKIIRDALAQLSTSGGSLDSPRPAELLDWDNAGRYLGTSGRHVRKLWSERRIAGIRVGRLIRFRPEDLDAFIVANRVTPIR